MNSKFLPRLQDIFFIALFSAVLLLGARMLNLDGDLPRHLLMGKYILETKTIPTTEPFIYPYWGHSYVSHEWLADVIFYAIYLYTGLAGIVIFSAFLLSATFTLLYSDLSARLHLRISILILVAWGALATSLNWVTRPHLISMLLLAIWLVWADQLRRGEKIPVWYFPTLMFFWSNLHGEFIAGILVLLAYSVGWIIDYWLNPESILLSAGRKLWLALGSSVIASVLNPAGIGPWVSLVGFVNNRYLMSRMVESNVPNFQLPEMRILFTLIIFSVFLLAIKKERISAAQGFLLAGFTAMSLMAFRNIHLYGVVAPFVLAETLDDVRKIRVANRLEAILNRVEGKISGVRWIVASVILLTTFVMTSSAAQKTYQFNSSMFPTQAVTWLLEHPQQGKMFNDINWGGYIALHLWPQQFTFIDSVADVNGEVTLQYETVITLASGWHDIFERYKIEWALIPSKSALAKELQSEYNWRILYQDETSVILQK